MDDDTSPRNSRLGSDECWRLLPPSGVGVLATAAHERADAFPINYLVDGRTLMFRSAPGAKMAELEIAPHAAYVVQGHNADGAWSVVLRGPVEILPDEVEVVGSGSLELASWVDGPKRVFIRLTPTSVEGRRILRSDLERAPHYG